MLRKRDLLVAEGVKFDADGRVAKQSLHVFVATEADLTTRSAKSKGKPPAKSTVSSRTIDKHAKRAKSKSSRQ